MQKLTCFLIDDDSDDRDIFSIAVDQADSHELVTATDGINALAILNARPDFTPDIIFLDLNMPLMDGRSTLIELKKIPRLKNIPVVMYTTSSYQKDIEDTRQLGAAHFLVKPSGIKSLVIMLTRLFTGTEQSFLLKS